MEGGSPKKHMRKLLRHMRVSVSVACVGEAMQATVGIICEYDPFHRGHVRQFQLIRERLPGARIVCLMSGVFTQRGMPALHAPGARVRAALMAGADIVLELPCAFSVRDAEHFALGGVSALDKLGFITHLSFGAEDAVDALAPAAALLESPTPAFKQALNEALGRGLSFAAAQGAALCACLPAQGDAASPWEKPNNILALCYLRAIKRLKSQLLPLPVRREGDYHANSLDAPGYPSATAVRAALLREDFAEAARACGYMPLRKPVCRPDALDLLLLHTLRNADAAELGCLPDCAEGLENRLKACAARAGSREELLSMLKTRRYTRARLNRLLCHALLHIDAALLAAHPEPEYVRLLGLRRGADELTARLRLSRLPVVSKAADADMENPLMKLDVRAYELWALGAGAAQGLMFTQGVCVV